MEKATKVVADHNDFFIEAGVATRPLSKLSDVPCWLRSAALHCVILRVKTEVDQFIEGLEEAGVLQSIRKYPELFFLCSSPNTNNLQQVCLGWGVEV